MAGIDISFKIIEQWFYVLLLVLFPFFPLFIFTNHSQFYQDILTNCSIFSLYHFLSMRDNTTKSKAIRYKGLLAGLF